MERSDMMTLFIFRSNSRGMQYGIGTYINELTNSLLKVPAVNIFIVSYRSGDKEYTVKQVKERLYEVFIPNFLIPVSQSNSFEKKYASSVVRLITELVPATGKVVFQMNYIYDLAIAQKLKEVFKYPVISIVHFAQWQQLFNGNRKKLRGLNLDEPSDNVEFTLSQERELYRFSDHIVSVTRYMKDFLIDEYGISPEKISVIHNGLDNSKFNNVTKGEKADLKKRLGFSEKDIIILFSGRIDTCKGVIFLIEAFENASGMNDNLRLVLMGQGSTYDCQKKLKSSFGKVVYTGFLEKELVVSFYKVADIGIMPSIYDHCPYTVLEMIANKIPVIASRINGLDELLNENSCFFIDPRISNEGDISFSISEISSAMVKLAENRALREKMADCAYNLFKEKFISSRMAGEMNNLYLSLAGCYKITAGYEKTERT